MAVTGPCGRMRSACDRTSRRRERDRPPSPTANRSSECTPQSNRHREPTGAGHFVCRDNRKTDPSSAVPSAAAAGVFAVGGDSAGGGPAQHFDWRDRELAIPRSHRANTVRVVSYLRPHRPSTLITMVALVGLFVGACSGGDTIDSTPTSAASSELISAGADLYAVRCAECHGADLRGTDRGPSHLSIVYEPNHHSDATFLLAVRNGHVLTTGTSVRCCRWRV